MPSTSSNLLRTYCWMSAVLYPGWSVLMRFLLPHEYDSMAGRFLVGSYFLILVLLSEKVDLLRKNFETLVYAGFYVVALQFWYLTYQANVSTIYVVGSMIVVVCYNLAFAKQRPLLYYSILVASLSVLVSLTANGPFESKLMLTAGIITVQITAFFSVGIRATIEEKLAEAESIAIASSAAKSEFLANMSHEIRTPISGVIGMTELVQDTNLTPDQRSWVDAIKISADSLLSVINDILDFSKVEAGKLDLELIDFDLNRLLESLHKTLIFAAGKKNLELKIAVDPDVPPRLNGDPGRVRQILTNLVNNGLKFTEKGGVTVHVKVLSTGTDGINLLFEITDTGIGLSPEQSRKLFQPFMQADASTTRKYGGTGLGLSICKRLTDLMNGQIGIRSEIGKGSTFWFSIHFANPVQAVADLPVKQNVPTAPTVLNPLRILVAEDNPILQTMIRAMLQKMGFTPKIVGDGRLVLAALDEQGYDLILMDCHMPEMDGFETTATIRAATHKPYSTIPIVALTATAMEVEKQKCLHVGMNDVATKPISAATLRKTIETWSGSSKSKAA